MLLSRSRSGLPIVGAMPHRGVFRRRVHQLKYDADLVAGRLLVGSMASLADPAWRYLIPVPRARIRHLRYGIDPAWWLAAELGRLLELPVLSALGAGLWWPSRGRGGSGQPSFRRRRLVPVGSVLIDDVATTGATLDAAAAMAPVVAAFVATSAMRSYAPDGPRRQSV